VLTRHNLRNVLIKYILGNMRAALFSNIRSITALCSIASKRCVNNNETLFLNA
jgi:hypothetical protein